VFLLLFDPRHAERFRIENETVVINGLGHDFGKQAFDSSNAVVALPFEVLAAMRPKFKE